MRYIFLALAILLLAGCSGDKDTASNEEGNTKKRLIKLKNDRSGFGYQVDPAQFDQYFDAWRERQELVPQMKRFYENREYGLGWFVNKDLVPHANKLVQKLQSAEVNGLKSAVYKINEIQKKISAVKGNSTEASIKELDLLLTSEALRYIADVSSGVTRYKKEQLRWFIDERRVRHDAILHNILASDGEDPFLQADPPLPAYTQLKSMLKLYREFAQKGGWPQLSGFEKLSLGDTSDHVVPLRQRLALTADLATQASAGFFNPKVFDKNVELAVKEFQARHGLEPDGVVGGNTLETMNVPVQTRINQVIVNMERWRLVPRNFPENYVMVNVPEFRLRVFENGSVVLGMKVIVGKEYHATPVFNDSIQFVVFSPYWNVPESILLNEILPAVSRNPYYFSQHNMEVMYGWGEQMTRVNPWEVPWYNAGNDGFMYWVRQRPGPKNPLGFVKFLFPNNHNVYLHDTPEDHLFERAQRGFSHGCIRVEKPFELAKYLLRKHTNWTEHRIQEAMNSGHEKFVRIEKLPVYILYFTTWMDENSKVHVRDDIYGLDNRLGKEMGVGIS